MSEENKKIEVVFVPGCFDNFDGTQEELDEMLAEIQRLADTGELFEKSTPVDLDALLDELSDEEIEEIMADSEEIKSVTKRNLH